MAVDLPGELQALQSMHRHGQSRPAINPALFRQREDGQLVELPKGPIRELVTRLVSLEAERDEGLREVQQARQLLSDAQRRDDRERAERAARGEPDQATAKSHEARERDRLLKLAARVRSHDEALKIVADEIVASDDDLAALGIHRRDAADRRAAELENQIAAIEGTLAELRRDRQVIRFSENPKAGLVVEGQSNEERDALAVLRSPLESPEPPEPIEDQGLRMPHETRRGERQPASA